MPDHGATAHPDSQSRNHDGPDGWAICSGNRWWSAFGKPRRGKSGRPGPPVHDDRVNRVFTAAAPNQLWLTDITEHRTAWFPAVVATPQVRGVRDAGEEVHRRAA